MTRDADPTNPLSDDAHTRLSLWPVGTTVPEPAELESRIWAKTQAKIEHPEPTRRSGRIRRARSLWLGTGVAIVLIAGVFLWSSGRRNAFVAAEQTYTTQSRQRASFTLPDGSTVVLGPASALTYTQSTDGARTATLSGMAVFSVNHNPAQSFVVTTGSVTTRVLGTTFQVERYGDDDNTTITVSSGKVESSGRRSSVVLTPGTMGIVTDSTATAKEVSAVETGMAWVDGRLVFQEAPVSSVLKTVGRWYGYTFKLADSSLAEQRITTTLLADQPTEGMQMLKMLLHVEMKFEGDTVTLRPTKKQSAAPTRRYADPVPPRTITAINTEIGK